MSSEKRMHTRIRTRIRGCLHHGDDVVEGVVENVGEGGVFFATEHLETLVDDGAEVTVEFEGKRNGELAMFRVPGTVLRTERYFDGAAVVRAFAVKFRTVQDFTAVLWEA